MQLGQAEKLLYVISPGGKQEEQPCKIGITHDPKNRIRSIRSRPKRSYHKEIGFARIYKCEREILAARSVENDYRDALRNHTLRDAEEWFQLKARVLIGALDRDERCRLVDMDEILS